MKKSYLIIGGSSGIGFAIAQKLATDNDVIIVSKSEDKLRRAKEKIGKNVCYYVCNLENVEAVSDIFSFIEKKNIVLSGMVYCAGISPLCLLKDNSIDLMEKVYRINLFSYIECCKYFYMEKYSLEGSKIVAIASVTAHSAGYRQILYGSSKAAMLSATKKMAKELWNRKIKINCVSPGITKTEMTEQLYEGKTGNIDEIVSGVQSLGIINPDSIAQMVLFLLYSKSNYNTGNEFIVDGGFLLN